MAVYMVPGVFGVGGQVLDSNGKVASGALVNVYAAGTVSVVNTFKDSLGAVTASNPIVTNSDGRLPNEMWQTAGTAIKIVLTDALANTLGTYDNLTGINDPTTILTTTNNWTVQQNFNSVSVTNLSVSILTVSSLTVSILNVSTITLSSITVSSIKVSSLNVSTANISALNISSMTVSGSITSTKTVPAGFVRATPNLVLRTTEPTAQQIQITVSNTWETNALTDLTGVSDAKAVMLKVYNYLQINGADHKVFIRPTGTSWAQNLNTVAMVAFDTSGASPWASVCHGYPTVSTNSAGQVDVACTRSGIGVEAFISVLGYYD